MSGKQLSSRLVMKLANFYRQFIHQYSILTAPLTSLLKGKPKMLLWTPEAGLAFNSLKAAFTTAPLLHHPDQEKVFVVEVDASTTGVGGILSQYSDLSSFPPCAFFSKKLSPAKTNYDIGNRELALEEDIGWRGQNIHFLYSLTTRTSSI